ncbi:MAG: hypothetical protein KJ749_13555 [Planctomycetes bacterium]|nr:hypothetical protein [Planctomycetota bacterium]
MSEGVTKRGRWLLLGVLGGAGAGSCLLALSWLFMCVPCFALPGILLLDFIARGNPSLTPTRYSFAPMIILNLLFYGFVGGVVGYAGWRRQQRRTEALALQCPKCGYNLTGNVSGVCSECGTEITAR